MKSFIAGLCGATVLTAAAIAAQNETMVTITGCVEKATQPGAYVISHLTESVPDNGGRPLAAIYWLNTTKGLHDQIGHTIEVTGTVNAKGDRAQKGKVKAQADGITGQTKLAVETGLKKAEVVNTDIPVGTSGTVTKVEIERPVYTLHVKSMRMIDAACRTGS